MSSSPPKSTPDEKKTPLFLVGPAGKRELRRALIQGASNPAATIQKFQQMHSLHTMMSRAFGTTPRYEYRELRSRTQSQNKKVSVESLDTDSVTTFLSHLGVTQFEIHKRITDTLLKQLEDEIRKTQAETPLLEHLKSCWTYSTTIPELRPILWAVLKQLGDRTPLAVLNALAERDEDGQLKHAEIFRPLPSLLKRLCWEADWDVRIPVDLSDNTEPWAYLDQVHSTLFCETIQPLIEEYMANKTLADAADRPFVTTARERRLLTAQRRALTASVASVAGGSSTLGPAATTLLRPSQATADTLTTGKAIAQLRNFLCATSGTSSPYRPKLLYGVLSILMAKHGALGMTSFLGGAKHLHCTLVADILLSAGGPLPKAYQHVHSLARLLDDIVQEGKLPDEALAKIQANLRLIFQQDQDTKPVNTESKEGKDDESAPSRKDASAVALQRQLNRIISSGITAMKDADPQNLFLNPVTDDIAPGYSQVITKPMCIVAMEGKVDRSEYKAVTEWEEDVKLMFKNCVDYNQGRAGKWFRDEAGRQAKVFREEIYPQARRLFQAEVAKRTIADEPDNRKRKAEDVPNVAPLGGAIKKRKKEKEEYTPSMAALAFMLLSDPFVVRIVMGRALREVNRSIVHATSLPAAHLAIPSLMQLLHMASWSTQVCAIRGKKYLVPDAGLEASDHSEDSSTLVPYISLRRELPLLIRLLLEAELDKRVCAGGDLYAASQNGASQPRPLDQRAWQVNEHMDVTVALCQGALVELCLPGNANEMSLATTFRKFAGVLQAVSEHLLGDKLFFLCLIQALLKHKSKLPKAARDSIVDSWLDWLRKGKTSVCSACHEGLVQLLTEWYSLGNILLPRDTLLQFAIDTVEAADRSGDFVELWRSEDLVFAPVKQQYERMLKLLPLAQSNQFRERVGINRHE